MLLLYGNDFQIVFRGVCIIDISIDAGRASAGCRNHLDALVQPLRPKSCSRYTAPLQDSFAMMHIYSTFQSDAVEVGCIRVQMRQEPSRHIAPALARLPTACTYNIVM